MSDHSCSKEIFPNIQSRLGGYTKEQHQQIEVGSPGSQSVVPIREGEPQSRTLEL